MYKRNLTSINSIITDQCTWAGDENPEKHPVEKTRERVAQTKAMVQPSGF